MGLASKGAKYGLCGTAAWNFLAKRTPSCVATISSVLYNSQMDHIPQLQKRQEANSARLILLRKEIEAIEIDNHKIGITLEILASMNEPAKLDALSPTVMKDHFRATVETPSTGEKVSVKQLILNELKKMSPLTKMDIVSRLYASGHQVNSTTVGSLLSKMVGTDLDKAGLGAYRLKGESPALTGLSDATESDSSKLI